MKLDSMAWKLESIYINDDLAETTSQACTGFFKGGARRGLASLGLASRPPGASPNFTAGRVRDPTGLVWIRITGGSSSELRVTAGVRGFPRVHISESTLLYTGLRRVTVGVQLE